METDRLLLRAFLVEDAPEIYRLNADTEVMRYLAKDEVFPDVDAAREFLTTYTSRSQVLPYARWAMIRKADGAWLGWCGLKLHDNGTTDLGFRLHQKYWGKGYATEAGRAWLAWGFEEAGLQRIIAQTTDKNLGSQRALTKLGFTRRPEEDYDEDGFRWWRYDIAPAAAPL